MKNTNTDRRSQRTRELLFQALTELMIEKNYVTITVQDIIDRANVGRSTFYAHFMDKEDLLASSFERMLDLLGQHMFSETADDHCLIPALALFRHVQERQDLYKAIMLGRGMELIAETGQKHLSLMVEQHLRAYLNGSTEPTVPLPVVATYVAGAFLTLLKWWVDNRMPYPPEAMSAMFEQLITPSLHAALGITA